MNTARKSKSARNRAARSFNSDQMMALLFDCSLGRTLNTEVQSLLSYMTGHDSDNHAVLAHMLCQQSLAQQFPRLLKTRSGVLSNKALRMNLAHTASHRREVLGRYLRHLIESVRRHNSSAPIQMELMTHDNQYELADELGEAISQYPHSKDWDLKWAAGVNRALFAKKIPIAKDSLELLLDRLIDDFMKIDRNADEFLRTWLIKRARAAKLPLQVAVRRLPTNSYTGDHLKAETEFRHRYKCPTLIADESHTRRGRLDYFRLEANRPPRYN